MIPEDDSIKLPQDEVLVDSLPKNAAGILKRQDVAIVAFTVK